MIFRGDLFINMIGGELERAVLVNEKNIFEPLQENCKKIERKLQEDWKETLQ